MRYDQPELIDRLAMSYVVGTLAGPARRRFERLSRERLDVSAAVQRWEAQLGELALGAPETAPSPRVWQAVEARIQPQQQDAVKLSFWQRLLGGWQPALAGMVAALVVAVVAVQLLPAPFDADYVASVQEEGTLLWQVSLDADRQKIRVQALSRITLASDQDYELWMLPKSGNPRSLGLLPRSGELDRELSAELAAALANAGAIAVSLEPAGGSTTGLPTGPVVHTAELRSV